MPLSHVVYGRIECMRAPPHYPPTLSLGATAHLLNTIMVTAATLAVAGNLSNFFPTDWTTLPASFPAPPTIGHSQAYTRNTKRTSSSSKHASHDTNDNTESSVLTASLGSPSHPTILLHNITRDLALKNIPTYAILGDSPLADFRDSFTLPGGILRSVLMGNDGNSYVAELALYDHHHAVGGYSLDGTADLTALPYGCCDPPPRGLHYTPIMMAPRDLVGLQRVLGDCDGTVNLLVNEPPQDPTAAQAGKFRFSPTRAATDGAQRQDVAKYLPPTPTMPVAPDVSSDPRTHDSWAPIRSIHDSLIGDRDGGAEEPPELDAYHEVVTRYVNDKIKAAGGGPTAFNNFFPDYLLLGSADDISRFAPVNIGPLGIGTSGLQTRLNKRRDYIIDFIVNDLVAYRTECDAYTTSLHQYDSDIAKYHAACAEHDTLRTTVEAEKAAATIRSDTLSEQRRRAEAMTTVSTERTNQAKTGVETGTRLAAMRKRTQDSLAHVQGSRQLKVNGSAPLIQPGQLPKALSAAIHDALKQQEKVGDYVRSLLDSTDSGTKAAISLFMREHRAGAMAIYEPCGLEIALQVIMMDSIDLALVVQYHEKDRAVLNDHYFISMLADARVPIQDGKPDFTVLLDTITTIAELAATIDLPIDVGMVFQATLDDPEKLGGDVAARWTKAGPTVIIDVEALRAKVKSNPGAVTLYDVRAPLSQYAVRRLQTDAEANSSGGSKRGGRRHDKSVNNVREAPGDKTDDHELRRNGLPEQLCFFSLQSGGCTYVSCKRSHVGAGTHKNVIKPEDITDTQRERMVRSLTSMGRINLRLNAQRAYSAGLSQNIFEKNRRLRWLNDHLKLLPGTSMPANTYEPTSEDKGVKDDLIAKDKDDPTPGSCSNPMAAFCDGYNADAPGTIAAATQLPTQTVVDDSDQKRTARVTARDMIIANIVDAPDSASRQRACDALAAFCATDTSPAIATLATTEPQPLTQACNPIGTPPSGTLSHFQGFQGIAAPIGSAGGLASGNIAAYGTGQRAPWMPPGGLTRDTPILFNGGQHSIQAVADYLVSSPTAMDEDSKQALANLADKDDSMFCAAVASYAQHRYPSM